MNVTPYRFVLAFILSLIGGLSTGLGGCLALFVKNKNTKFLSFSLGFSAGVMIYISFVEILKESNHFLVLSLEEKLGGFLTIVGFFGGILIITLLNKIIPFEIYENKTREKTNFPLIKAGLFTALIIAIHNIPEGIISFLTSLKSLSLGIAIVIAIALHNIPEGIAVSIPIYYATKNKGKALFYSFLSGITEPLGALLGYFLLRPFLNDLVFGLLYALIAGIMVYISFNELLPTAKIYGEDYLVNQGLILGMAFMAFNMWLFI
ncbi:MAG: zinc transporter ZupT [Bacilli bacterium]|jgi:ZIP family zinc transporter